MRETARHTPSWYVRKLRKAVVWLLIALVGVLDALLVYGLVMALAWRCL